MLRAYIISLIAIQATFAFSGILLDGGGDNPTQLYDPDNVPHCLNISLGLPHMLACGGALLQDVAYVIGGSVSNNTWGGVNTVNIYDPMGNVNVKGATLMQGRFNPAVVVTTGAYRIPYDVVVCGGRANDVSLSSCEAYAARMNRWVSFPSLPYALDGVQLLVLDAGKGQMVLYAFGGYNATSNENTNAAYLFDTNTQMWVQSIQQMPFGKAFHSAIPIYNNTMALLCGGRRNGTDCSPSTVCHIYLSQSDSWGAAGYLKEARQGHRMVFYKNNYYVIGGVDANCKPLKTVELYDLARGGSDAPPLLSPYQYWFAAVPLP